MEKDANRYPKVLFFHIMKTGGTSLSSFLDQQFNLAKICPARHWYELDQYSQAQLSKYSLFHGHFTLEQLKSFQPSSFTITLIRDPLERLVSEYYHWRRAPDQFVEAHPQYTKIRSLARQYTLEEFIEHDHDCNMPINNRQTYQLSIVQLTSFDLNPIEPSQALIEAKENLGQFSLVGTTESLDITIRSLCLVFGWLFPTTLPVLRAKKPESYPELSEELRTKILEANHLDVELYALAQKLAKKHYSNILFQYGGGTHERTPNDDDLSKILNARYEAGFRARNPTLASKLTFTFDQALDGDGWQSRQFSSSDPSKIWRWTGPSTTTFLDLPLQYQVDLRITLELLAVSPQFLLETLEVKVNGTKLSHTLITNDDTFFCIVDIPSKVLKSSPGCARLHVEIKKTVEIPAPYTGSYLKVGVALAKIHVQPLSFWDKLRKTHLLRAGPSL